jgi:subtilisin family serine protease
MFICGLLLAGSLAGLIAMIPPPKSEEPQRKTAIAAVAAVQALRRGFDLPPAGESRYVQNEVLLDIPATVPTTTLDRIATRHHMTRVETTTIELTGRTLHRWRIEDGRSVRAVIMRLSRERVIAGAGANYLYSLDQEPARHGQPSYAARKLNLGEAHALATGAKIRIALIDSGVDATHPDIASAIIGSFDTLDDDKLHPHGTAMAGAIVSIAPRVELLSVRVFSARATATTLGILLGLDWAASAHRQHELYWSARPAPARRAAQGQPEGHGADRCRRQCRSTLAAAVSGCRSADDRSHRDRPRRPAVRKRQSR